MKYKEGNIVMIIGYDFLVEVELISIDSWGSPRYLVQYPTGMTIDEWNNDVVSHFTKQQLISKNGEHNRYIWAEEKELHDPTEERFKELIVNKLRTELYRLYEV